jgi:RHS repeat-associated protein
LSRFASIFQTLLIILAGGNFAAACNQESFASLGDLFSLAVQSSFPDNDQLTSDTYDANGNTTVSSSRPAPSSAPVTVTDVYSFDNKLIRRTRADGVVIDLYYNADGDRVGKWVKQNGLTLGTHRYLVDRQNPTGYSQVVEETDSTGTLLERAFYGHDLLATESRSVGVSPTSSLFFYHYDGIGSVRGISDDTGALLETYTYDAYGTLIGLEKPDPASGALVSQNLTNPQSAPLSSHLFTGEQWDADLGMYFLRARYLNPDTGRFHTRDTYEGRNGEPLSLHKYLYANGNPVMMRDPSGRFSLVELSATELFIVNFAVSFTVSVGTNYGIGGERRWDRLLLHGAIAGTLGGFMGPIAGRVESAILAQLDTAVVGLANQMVIRLFQGIATGFTTAIFSSMDQVVDIGLGDQNDFDVHRAVMAAFLGGISVSIGGIAISDKFDKAASVYASDNIIGALAAGASLTVDEAIKKIKKAFSDIEESHESPNN